MLVVSRSHSHEVLLEKQVPKPGPIPSQKSPIFTTVLRLVSWDIRDHDKIHVTICTICTVIPIMLQRPKQGLCNN